MFRREDDGERESLCEDIWELDVFACLGAISPFSRRRRRRRLVGDVFSMVARVLILLCEAGMDILPITKTG